MITATARTLVAALALGALAACSSTVQTTSGASYIRKYETSTPLAETSFRNKIREAALVEPTLRFPARIGLARVEGGRLTVVPAKEADAWVAIKEKLGPRFGEFVPISPLIAALAAGDVDHRQPRTTGQHYAASGLVHLIQRIRIGAARQHVDAVLIYEVIGKKRQSGTALNIADLTVIGAYLFPSRIIKAQGYATALLVDVRNGYPYGTAQAVAKDGGLAPTVWSDEGAIRLEQRAKEAAVEALTKDVEKMMNRLYVELPRQMLER